MQFPFAHLRNYFPNGHSDEERHRTKEKARDAPPKPLAIGSVTPTGSRRHRHPHARNQARHLPRPAGCAGRRISRGSKGQVFMNVLLLSMPDSFEHMAPVAIRMPNGALTS